MMRRLRSFPSFQTWFVKSLASIYQPKTLLHSHLKPPRSNQTLKEHLKSNQPMKALFHFRDFVRKTPSSIDSFSLLFALKACTQIPYSVGGKQVHTLVIKLGFESVIQLRTSLINLCSAARNLTDAHQLFDEMPDKNVVSWTALISAHVENQKPSKALELFRDMRMQDLEPDEVTVTVALSACADLGALEMGEWVHSYIRHKKGFNMDLSLRNSLINMYVKCGDVTTARKLFDETKRKDVTTWTSMIVGHALHSQAKEALELFAKMKVPSDVTFIGVLMACSHAGFVEEGKQHFKSMTRDYNLKPRDAHFGCMVDIFCRAGLLDEAYDFILNMPVKPNAVIWRTLFGACILYGNHELGEGVQKKLFDLGPICVGDNVALSNIYASKGKWDEKINVRDQIKKRRMPGKSSIEVRNGISEFVSGNNEHPMMSEIAEVLKCLIDCMRSYGNSPEFSCTMEY